MYNSCNNCASNLHSQKEKTTHVHNYDIRTINNSDNFCINITFEFVVSMILPSIPKQNTMYRLSNAILRFKWMKYCTVLISSDLYI